MKKLLLVLLLSLSSSSFAEQCNVNTWNKILSGSGMAVTLVNGECKSYYTNTNTSSSYTGNCACPYDTASDGSICGGRSAWSKSGGASPVCYINDSSANTINSRIEGEFEGYEYGNVYHLINGQAWQQTSATYNYSYKYGPRVTIRNGEMRVDGMSRSVRVTRYY